MHKAPRKIEMECKAFPIKLEIERYGHKYKFVKTKKRFLKPRKETILIYKKENK